MSMGLPDLPINGLLVAIVYAVAAGAVTVHVLLRKRSVRAAIGWIGLAWLSPVFGAALYYLFGINRVTRRASRLRRADLFRVGAPRSGSERLLAENIAAMAGIVERLTGRELADGNSISVLRSGDEAYPAMLSAIRNARRSIALASYIFRADDAGRSFVAALAEALSRGVEIRVLVDGIGGGYMFSPIVRRLRREGITVARFLHHWLPWRMPYLNMRSHKKILVVDGSIGFTGGINIGCENVLARHPRNPVHDVHFRVDGPVVRHLMASFAEDWNFTAGETLEGDAWWPEIGPAGPVLGRGISSGPDEAVRHLESVLAAAVSAATRRLRIVTPYFLPDERLMSEIELAALRGVAVDLVLPERSDNILLDWATRAHVEAVAPDVRIYLTPRSFDHAKLMTLDGQWCLVGSANWDVRSTRLNFEFSLECYNEAAAGEIDRMIDLRIEKARRLSSEELATRPLPFRLRDAAARLLLPYL